MLIGHVVSIFRGYAYVFCMICIHCTNFAGDKVAQLGQGFRQGVFYSLVHFDTHPKQLDQALRRTEPGIPSGNVNVFCKWIAY